MFKTLFLKLKDPKYAETNRIEIKGNCQKNWELKIFIENRKPMKSMQKRLKTEWTN